MKIHILSDLHNEFSVYDQPSPEADVIVLAGDIDNGSRGIAWARMRWPDKNIVFVPGNHEYYGSEIGRVNDEMQKAAEVYNVHLLNPGSVEIDGVRFIGAILWTDFKYFGQMDETRQLAMIEAMICINDFRIIDIDERTFSPLDSVKLHQSDLKFLRFELIKPFEGKTVIVTHHLPCSRSVARRYEKDILAAAFASNLDSMMDKCDLWIHGHTHDSFDYEHPMGARVICNPRGYSRYSKIAKNGRFDAGKVFRI